MTLLPFLSLSSVSSFLLFVLLFLYGREDNLQTHKMPTTTNVDRSSSQSPFPLVAMYCYFPPSAASRSQNF